MSLNATVTLSIGELDALRQEIREKGERIADLEAKQRTMKIRILQTKREFVEDPMWKYHYSHINRNTEKGYWEDKVIEEFQSMDDVLAPIKEYIRTEFSSKTDNLSKEIDVLRKDKDQLNKKVEAQRQEIATLKNSDAVVQLFKLEEEASKLRKDLEQTQKALDKVSQDWAFERNNSANQTHRIKAIMGRGFWARVFNFSVV